MTNLKAEDFKDEIKRLLDQINQAKRFTREEDLEPLYAELLQLVISQGCVEVDPCTQIYNKLNGGLNNDGFKTSI